MDSFFNHNAIIISLDVDACVVDTLHQVVKAGFHKVELNAADPRWLAKIIHDFPMLQIGAGNIMDTQQLEDCYQAGVSFATSPGFMPSIAQTAQIYSMNYIPGVATLSEAMQAKASGCQHVRPFPANLAFCTLLNKYLPGLQLYPAEIQWEEAEHFLSLPSVVAVSILNPEREYLNAYEALHAN